MDLSDHPVHRIAATGRDLLWGRWHHDRISHKGYAFEARIYLKSFRGLRTPKKFVIIGRPRSGTTLLVRLLNQVDAISCHGEILHHAVANPVRFLDLHARTRPDSAECVGAKIISYQMFQVQRLKDHTRFLTQLAQRGFQFIHARRNTFDQCLSLSTAQKSQTYHVAQGASDRSLEMALDVDQFIQQVRWNLAMLDYETQLLARFDPFVVHYDTDLKQPQNHQQTIDGICAWLGQAPNAVQADLKRTSRMTTITNQDVLKRAIQQAGLSQALTDG